MDMESLIDVVKEDLKREGSYDRYPTRFLSMKYEDTTADNIIKLQTNISGVEFYDIKDLLVHEDAWITPDNLYKSICSLNSEKSFIVVGFSEYARFLSQPEFVTLIISLLGIENSAKYPKRRIYIPCFALYNQIKKTVKQYHKRIDVYNPFINETDIEDLPRIYFVNNELDVDVKSNEITSSVEWFGMWRNDNISTNKPIICSSETLSFFYSQASPDNVYNIQKICTYEDVLKYMYQVDGVHPYEKDKEEFLKRLVSLIKNNEPLSLNEIILKRLNAQSIDERNVYTLWKNADTFDKWLIQNYVLLNTNKNSYINKAFGNLDDLTNDAFIESIYDSIFEFKKSGFEESRELIISSVYKSNHDIKFTDRMISYYKGYIAEVIRKKTTIVVDELDFSKEDDLLAEKKEALEEVFIDELYPYLTSYSTFERKLIIWLFRLGIVSDKVLDRLYPQLSYYISTTHIGAESGGLSDRLDEYFNNYRRCRLTRNVGEKYDEYLLKWNSDENVFYSWYMNSAIDYPEIFIRKNADNNKIYVLDGVGAEFFGYIIKLLENKGFSIDKKAYTKAHLPSITSIGKKYYNFDNEWINDFDEKVIHGGLYNHVENIEKSLSTIESIIDCIISKNRDGGFVITADHGASIGHKLSKKEKKYDFEKSEHDGRCYHNKEKKAYVTSNDYIIYDSEDGEQWIIALNQQSLFNSSKYSVHGGGTPEEVIVPVIYAKKGKNQDRSYNIRPVNLKVSGLQKEVAIKISPMPKDVEVHLSAADGTDIVMNYYDDDKIWKGLLKRGIEQDIIIMVGNNKFVFRTIPPTKMGDDLFDD